MQLSRVTWLVFGTALVLVAAVLAAAVLFINGGGPSFPSGGGAGPGASVHVRTPEGTSRGGSNPSGRTRFAISRGGRAVAARPAAAGLAATLGTSPANGGPTPGTPPGEQYGGRLEQLKAALGR